LYKLVAAQVSGTRMLDEGFALVVEDNQETQSWLVSCVANAFSDMQTHATATIAGALDLIATTDYQLALIDLGLPDGSGLDLIRILKSQSASCHVVVATIYDDDRNLFTALRSGAQGYILKDQDQDKIVSYLLGIKQNKPAMSAASSQRLIEHFNSKGVELDKAQLTAREIDVTRLIAKGYSVDETANLLNLSPDTIKGYVKNIYVKLGVSNRSEVTMQAIKLGLVDSD